MIPEGFHIHHYHEVSSTNKEALDLIDRRISNETVIIADKQTEGRGRTGKRWVSLEGNFCASLIVNLPQAPRCNTQLLDASVNYLNDRENLSKLTELTFVTALAVGNTLLSFINDLNLQYKWPNDILVDGKKISGILLEKKSVSNWLVIGVGINIDHAPFSWTTCVSSYGESMSNTDLLKALIISFNKLRKQWIFDGFYTIREMWLKKAFKMNKQISVKLADKLHEGIFVDIDRSGRLALQKKDGSLIYFDAGELFVGGTL
ncbi:biotin--[acetyl-CoA-carboxylase] ligase [Wolbachia endosymbiont of Atemnus politus]|uniref:biotin--[acetyl-CoA-carboxylase] ligase n=1 Tax=Wolbachia endosymbiont of Atemnus politus TaxID=2682840 RepID=UPI001574C581|nr:biotin--[acetyl-CoA-carboxylase] ligase [Wolbachia endosymbiont of Atemnus politus]NSX83364.1 biotin--[acetyl-CoA-carboxylase] ligase [Wolbachia endosymbiont of Atemnus politus]